MIKLVFPQTLGYSEDSRKKSEAKLKGFSRYEGSEKDDDSELGQKQKTRIRKIR